MSRFALSALALALCGGAVIGWYQWGGSATTTLDRLRLAAAANDWSAVRAEGSGYLRRHRNDAEALVLVARAEAAEKRFDRALDLLARVPAGSWSPEAHLREGQCLRQTFRGAAAEAAFKQTIELALQIGAPPRVLDAARLGVLQICATEARYDEARQLIWELYPTSPQPTAVLELLGRLDVEGAEPHEASQELEQFLAQDPDDFQARRGLAHHYLVLGRVPEARRLAEQCVQARRHSLPAWETLLACLNDLGDAMALGEAIGRVPAAARETAWFWKYHGNAAENSGQWESAETSWRKTLGIDPFDSRTHFRLGQLLHRLDRDRSESDEHIERARELTAFRGQLREVYRQVIFDNRQSVGPSAELCARMGSLYESLGLLDGAGAWYRESLNRDPKNIRSYEGVTRLNAASDMQRQRDERAK